MGFSCFEAFEAENGLFAIQVGFLPKGLCLQEILCFLGDASGRQISGEFSEFSEHGIEAFLRKLPLLEAFKPPNLGSRNRFEVVFNDSL